MIMNKRIIMFVAVMLLMVAVGTVVGDDANATQYLTMAKMAFQDAKEVIVFISEADLAKEKDIINRAALQNKLKVKIYLIANSIDVGKRMREIPSNSILVVYQSEVLRKKSTQLFILKKCKDKQIAVITSSNEYSELGALIGLVKTNGRFELVLNLKQNSWAATRFPTDVIERLGIGRVIQ
ncbi:hypothetical protein KAR48_12105 [bacterium]|nr:hypothetical protein [bacterium]